MVLHQQCARSKLARQARAEKFSATALQTSNGWGDVAGYARNKRVPLPDLLAASRAAPGSSTNLYNCEPCSVSAHRHDAHRVAEDVERTGSWSRRTFPCG